MESATAPSRATVEVALDYWFPSHTRRLSDKILIAFHQACDQEDLEVAQHLLSIAELIVARRPVLPDHQRRRSMETLVASYERLWYLKHKARVEEATLVGAS
jgi:hypothetical protein